ncbi:hypothetical protein IJ384_06340 [bacterium]|nr:hypothetical protein [bacterium]
MENKCSKYEGLFIFSTEEELMKHLEECPDCRAEHEKMQKVSNLIGETKFYYRSKSNRIRKLKAVCALALFMFFSATFGVVNNDNELADSLMYGDTLTAEDLGFPVDSYGLLMVDDEF